MDVVLIIVLIAKNKYSRDIFNKMSFFVSENVIFTGGNIDKKCIFNYYSELIQGAKYLYINQANIYLSLLLGSVDLFIFILLIESNGYHA